jgi:transposase-like protein
MNTQTANCRHCTSTDAIRHGYTAKGKQRYRCRDCGRCFVEDPASVAYDPARKEEILKGLPPTRLFARRQPHLGRLAQYSY